jgi:predicted MFS family arabinose efflux permease
LGIAVYTRQPHYFWLGEVGMAAVLAGVFAVPAGCYLAGRSGIALAFILAMIVFMPLFVFLPKLIQRRMQADAQAVIDAFGKNEQVMKVIWALVIAMTGLVITKVLDPGMAQEVMGVITSAAP